MCGSQGPFVMFVVNRLQGGDGQSISASIRTVAIMFDVRKRDHIDRVWDIITTVGSVSRSRPLQQ